MACAVHAPPPVAKIHGSKADEAVIVAKAESRGDDGARHTEAVPLPFPPAVIDRLAGAAIGLRSFLARVHFAHERVEGLNPGALYHPTDAFNLAKARYEKVWMPLLAEETKNSNGVHHRELAAPLDVQWMHHLHRLDPGAYRADCDKAFGRLIDPCGPFLAAGDGAPCDDVDAERVSREKWSAVAPEWPFDLDDALAEYRRCNKCLPQLNSEKENARGPKFDSRSCDLVGTATRQGGFLWQVLLSSYADPEFIETASKRYALLVGLWRDIPDEFLVPTYDQDLVWHAHLSFPSQYAWELREVTGRVIGHDDSVNDRTAGAKLDVRGRRTRELWNMHYTHEPYTKRGVMWRGDPPDWYWTGAFAFDRDKETFKLNSSSDLFAGAVCESSNATVHPAPTAVELSPGVFYAPARPDIWDQNSGGRSRRNERAGWVTAFEGFVAPPFGRPFDPAMQYIAVNVFAPPAAETRPYEMWLRVQVPGTMFPGGFQRDYPTVALGFVSCLFVLPIHPAQFPNSANQCRFITPIDLRRCIDMYEKQRLYSPAALPAVVFGMLCCCTPPRAQSDYGLGQAPHTQHLAANGGCSSGGQESGNACDFSGAFNAGGCGGDGGGCGGGGGGGCGG